MKKLGFKKLDGGGAGGGGFTLIEVVLVIAIGALIFLLAFIAFGNAQVNRRDSQRRNALDTMAAEVENFRADKGGALPSDTAALNTYISGLKDPSSGVAYTIDGALDTPGDYFYQKGTTGGIKSCAEEPSAIKATGFKIEMKLEKGVACRDSLQK